MFLETVGRPDRGPSVTVHVTLNFSRKSVVPPFQVSFVFVEVLCYPMGPHSIIISTFSSLLSATFKASDFTCNRREQKHVPFHFRKSPYFMDTLWTFFLCAGSACRLTTLAQCTHSPCFCVSVNSKHILHVLSSTHFEFFLFFLSFCSLYVPFVPAVNSFRGDVLLWFTIHIDSWYTDRKCYRTKLWQEYSDVRKIK